MTRALLALVLAVAAAGCGQKGPLIAPEPEPVVQPSDDAGDEDSEDAEARRRRDR